LFNTGIVSVAIKFSSPGENPLRINFIFLIKGARELIPYVSTDFENLDLELFRKN